MSFLSQFAVGDYNEWSQNFSDIEMEANKIYQECLFKKCIKIAEEQDECERAPYAYGTCDRLCRGAISKLVSENMKYALETMSQFNCRDNKLALFPNCLQIDCDRFKKEAAITYTLPAADFDAYDEFQECMHNNSCADIMGPFKCNRTPYEFALCYNRCLADSTLTRLTKATLDLGDGILCHKDVSSFFSMDPYKCKRTVCKGLALEQSWCPETHTLDIREE